MDEDENGGSHYRFRISLRIRHPSKDPADITREIDLEPSRSWRLGEPGRTPRGKSLEGLSRDTYWTAVISSGKEPDRHLNAAIDLTLQRLARHRSFFHQVRSEGGAVELLVGWFFMRQSGDLLSHEVLALAGDLQIDLSLDIYPPHQTAT